MRTPFEWTLTLKTSPQVLCACCALWGAPAAALATPEQVTPATMVVASASATAPSMANDRMTRIGGASLDRRVLTLLAMGCIVGLIAGWVNGAPRKTHFRLLNKPTKVRPSVLVPAGPAPCLIPSHSPHATRAHSTRAPVSRQRSAGVLTPGTAGP